MLLEHNFRRVGERARARVACQQAPMIFEPNKHLALKRPSKAASQPARSSKAIEIYRFRVSLRRDERREAPLPLPPSARAR